MPDLVTRRPYSRRAGEDTITWPNGSQFHVLTDPADTIGRFSLLEDRSTQGFAPGPHLHREADEAWYLLEGELQVYVGNQVFQATAGSFILIPRGTSHSFMVISEVARKLILFSPSGDEEVFRSATEPLPDGYTRPDWIRHTMESVGMERVPAPPWE